MSFLETYPENEELRSSVRLNETGVPLLPEKGKAFAVLPTQVSLPLQINVQADWLLDISRRGFMDFQNNPWHIEIIDQLPELIRSFLEWQATLGASAEGWQSGYSIIPDCTVKDRQSEWIDSERFVKKLIQELGNCRFLPVLTDSGWKFSSPNQSCYTPSALASLLAPENFPWVLFDSDVIDTNTLGDIPFKRLVSLNLLHELNDGKLAERWEKGAVPEWIICWGEQDERRRQSTLLFSCLNALGENWDLDQLRCIPTETWDWKNGRGDWKRPNEVIRLPGNWQILSKEKRIAANLKQFAGENDDILNTSIYFYTYRSVKETEEIHRLGKSREFLDMIKMKELEQLVEEWWKSLPESNLSTANLDDILTFTFWVKEKLSQQSDLVKKVLARDARGNLKLLSPESTLLSTPYAGKHRRVIFSKLPVIVDHYYKKDPTDSSPNDWRSFFESIQPSPKGPLAIDFSLESIPETREESDRLFHKWVPLRVTYMTCEWRGFKIDNCCYYVLNGQLSFLEKIGQDYGRARNFAGWLAEDPGCLSQNKHKTLGYIPYGYSSITTSFSALNHECMQWVSQLSETPWVPGKDKACYRPCDVLLQLDPLRPDAPFAELPEELTETLTKIGIEFGSAIARAPSVIKFQRSSLEATHSELLVLLEEAIAEVEGKTKEEGSFQDFLLRQFVVLLPFGRVTPDKLVRIPFKRIVLHTGPGKFRRSDLMGWIIAKDEFEDRDSLTLIERIEAFTDYKLPDTTTFEHTISFLQWVWTAEPPADEVRSFLRSAYDYIEEDLRVDDELLETWSEAVKSARVYTSKRQWAKANEVYFDDIRKPGLLKLVEGLDTASSGHLGSDMVSAKKIAQLLGLGDLSERIDIRATYGEDDPFPPLLRSHLDSFINTMDEYLNIEQVEEEEKDADEKILNINIRRVDRIAVEVFDNGKKIHEKSEICDYDRESHKITVTGETEDFAQELCQTLVEVWSLSRRGDFVARIAFPLSYIGQAVKFSKSLSKLRDALGIEPPKETQDTTEQSNLSPQISDVAGKSSVECKQEERRTKATGNENGSQSDDGTPPNGDSQEQELPADKWTNEAATSKMEASKDQPHRDNKGSQNAKDATECKKGVTNSATQNDTIKERRRVNRIVTYVFPDETDDEDEVLKKTDPKKYERNLKIGETAEQLAKRHEEENGRKASRMPRNNPGYDIESYGTIEEDVKFIEVKGIDGPWTEMGVGITARQYQEARDKSNLYWLYVVEDVFSEAPTIHKFQNPVAGIGSYRFDQNWRMLSAQEQTADKENFNVMAVGSLVEVDGKQATVIDQQNWGQLVRLTVRFEDGTERTLLDQKAVRLIM